MFLSGLYRPVLTGSRHSINNCYKVSVKAYVYHLVKSGIPHAGIVFQTAGSMGRISLVYFAPADRLHALEVFSKIPVSVNDVVCFIFSFTLGVLSSF